MSTQSHISENFINPEMEGTKNMISSNGVKIEQTPTHYLIDERDACLVFEEDGLADELEDYLIESLIQDIFYMENYLTRVSALAQLNAFIDQNKIKRIVRIIAKNERNPKLKSFAQQLLLID